MKHHLTYRHYTTATITTGHIYNLTSAMQCLKGELSASDCHNDISPTVAHLMGFYEGLSASSHQGCEDAIDLILQDILACLTILNEYNAKRPDSH